MDEYDDLLARVRSGSTVPVAPALPAAPTGAPKIDEYESLLKQVRTPNLVPAQSAAYNGSFSNPAMEAEKHNLARDIKKMLGEDISPSIVDPVEDRRRIRQAEMDHGIRQSASLRKWIEDDPGNAGLVGQKDISSLLTVDGALHAGRRVLGSVTAGLTADPAAAFYTTAAMPFKLGEQAAGLVLPDWMAQSEMGKALLWAARESKKTGDVASGARGDEGNIEAGVYSGFRSLGGNLGTMLTGGMLGLGAKGTTAMMSAIAGGGSALKAFDQGASATTALALGGADMAAEYATELPGMKALLATPGLKQGMMSFARSAANFGVKEMLGEQVATVWQDFNEWALLNPEKTLDDYLAARPDAAIQTAVATLIGGGGQIAIQQAMIRGKQAETRALFDALHEGAQNSELLKNVPEKYREFVKKATAEGGIDTVFIPAEQFTTYFQGRDMDPALIAKELGASNYTEAMAVGSDVMIPMDAFATLIAGTDHYQGLADDLRLSQGDMTARELSLAEANKGESEKQLEAELQRLAAETDTTLSAQIKQITEDVAGQLGTRYDQKTAETMSQVMRGIAVLTARDVQGKAQAEGRTASEAEIQQAISAQLAKYDIKINANPLLPEILTKRPNFKAEIDPFLDMLRSGQGPSEQDIFGKSLVDFIRDRGGLAPVVELKDVEQYKTPTFKTKLIQDLGAKLDEMAMAAVDAGYFPGTESGQLTETQLVEAILNELGGAKKTFAGFDEQKLNARETLEALSKALDQYGLDPKTMDNEAIKAALFAEPTYEQGGTTFKAVDTESAEFKAWSGGAPIKSEGFKTGEAVVIRGQHASTYGDITEFKTEEQRFGKAGYGFYFSDAAGANLFAEYGEKFQMPRSAQGEEKAVKTYPVFIAMRNPLVVDHVDDLKPYLDAGQKFGVARGIFGNLSPDAITKLQKQGYDGIISRETTAPKVHKTQGLKILDRNDPKATSFPVFVAFRPEQIKSAVSNTGAFSATNPNILYQPGDAPDLIIQHNLSADNLLHAVKMGGIPVPSLAVTKKDHPLQGFGEITLLGSKEMADPKGYAGTKVFGADIYSPRYPSVKYITTPNMRKRGEAMIKDGLDATNSTVSWEEVADNGVRELSSTPALRWKFLKERGIEPKIVRTELKPLPKELQPFKNDDRHLFDLERDPAFIEAAYAAHERELVKAYGGDAEAKTYAADEIAKLKSNADAKGVSYLVRESARQVNQYRMDTAAEGKVDTAATNRMMESQIYDADLRDQMDQYSAEFLQSINPEEKIFQGYTYSGKRRYTPHTLENVVKILKKEIRGGENFNYGVGNIRAMLTPQFKSIEQIRKAKGRLMDKAAFEKVKDEIDNEFFAISEQLSSYHPVGKEFRFTDSMTSMMYDAAKIGVPRALKENGFSDVPVENQRDVAEYLEKLRNLPTEYFEAKILRDVDLAEFSGAVVPEGVNPKVIEALQARGIKDIRTYKKGDQADRTAKIGEFESLFFQKGGTENRAQIRISADRKINIDLLKDANWSSFSHEVGHFYLEFLGDLAENGSQQTKDDYAAILKWFGITSRDQITREHHEMFARANERYLMEGKAPSKDLRAAFARFKAWLTSIYRSLVNLKVPMTDEVREVFDRIYATDAEIAAARAENDFIDTFVTAEQMGVSQAEFEAYKKQAAGEIQEGTDELRNKIMRVQRLKREAWWREELDRTRKEVEAEIDAMKEYQTLDALSEKGAELKLDRKELIERYGSPILKRLPRGYGEGKGAIYTAADERGASVGTVAQLMGYDSGDALIEAMSNLRPRKKLIAAEADARMNSRYGDILNSIEIADEAQESLHNEERGKKLAMEVRALNKAIGRALIDPESVMREAASRVMATKLIRDVRPNDYLIAERKANREAFKAMAENNRIEAFEAKQRELLNFAMYREATRVKDEMKKLHDFVARFEKGPMREKLGKAGDQYLEAAQAILEDVELTNKSLKAIDRSKIRQWLQLQENSDLYVTEDMVSGTFAKNWKDLTVEEMRAISDALRNIDHVAGRQLKIMSGQRMIDLQEAVDGAVASAVAANKLQPQQLSKPVKGFGDAFMDWMGDLLNVRTMANWLDGGKADGWWHTVLINRASDAQVEYYKLIRSIVMPVNEMVEKYMDTNGKNLDDVFQSSLGPVTRGQALSIAFNLGNSSNKDKMIRGGMPKWSGDGQVQQWNESDINQIVGNLDSADWNFIQSIWTMLDTQMYPAINELEKRVNGVPLKKVEAAPFEVVTKDGQTLKLKGGYYPMSYDPRFSDAGKKQEAGPLAGLIEGNFAYVTTPKGQTKERIESFARPANLDFSSVLGRHLSQSILDLTHREFFMDAQKFLKQPKIRQTLQERLGDGFEKEFNNWLKRIANQGANSPTESMTRSARVAEQLRTNTTILFLGFKITTIMAQFAGLSNSVELLGPGWMWRGTQETFSNPARSMKMVLEKSGRMQQRWNTLDQSIYEAMGKLHRNKYERARDAVNRAAFAGIAIADRLVSTPTWIGAYRSALSQGMSEENAIHAGDDAVLTSQGDGASMELSKIQGERGFTRLFTVFYTPFAAQFNRLYTAGRKLKQNGIAYSPEFIMRATMITMIPAIIADLLTARGPQNCEIDDATCFAKWAAVKGLSSLLATVPFIREGGQMLEQSFEGNYKPDLKYSPVFSAIERAGGATKQTMEVMAGEREMTDEVFFKDLESSGLILGLPTTQVAITGEYLWDLLSGEDSGETWYKDLFMRRKVHD